MSKRDLASLFPDPRQSLRTMQAAASRFYRCPNGHVLPHRVVSGRCTPVDCADSGELGTRTGKSHDSEDATTPYAKRMAILPRGLERQAMEEGSLFTEQDAEAEAQAEEALAQARARGIRAAREAVHDYPEIRKAIPDDGKVTLQERARLRFEDATMYAVEVKINAMLHGSSEQRNAAAEEILDRAGVPRRREAVPDYSGPVIMVMSAGTNPYEQQIKGVVNGEVIRVEVGNGSGQGSGARSDAQVRPEAGGHRPVFGAVHAGRRGSAGAEGGGRDGTQPARRDEAPRRERAAGGAQPQASGGLPWGGQRIPVR